jgi:peroxisomal enoyl-CoA hydratase 2
MSDLSEFLNGEKRIEASYSKRDLIVYALGIGASELPFVYENDEQFAAFPTFPIVLPFKGTAYDVVGFPSDAMMEGSVVPPVPGTKFVLDGERYLEVIV